MQLVSPDLKPWYQIRERFDEIILKAGDDAEVKRYRNQYYPKAVTDKIEQDSIFWYEPGRYGQTEIAGVFLRGVIPAYVQRATYDALSRLKWRPPRRKETLPAKELQRGGKIEAGELVVGHSHSKGVMEYAATSREWGYVKHVEPMLRAVDGIFGRVLPQQHYAQNLPKPLREREIEAIERKGMHPNIGGIPARYRLFLTSFSSLALLRNCPTAIHKDQNARGDTRNYSCLTSVAGPDGFKGGTFCLPEYDLLIPVKPGDLLIVQSSREWHCNMGRVTGDKISIVAYYKTYLAYPTSKPGPSVPKETQHDIVYEGLLTGEAHSRHPRHREWRERVGVISNPEQGHSPWRRYTRVPPKPKKKIEPPAQDS
jgi:hypothetical protein